MTFRSVMYSPRKQPSMQRQIANRTFSFKYASAKPRFHVYASFDLERDYSVDSKSDSLFRSFSRIDPRYDHFQRKGQQHSNDFNTKKELQYPNDFNLKKESPYSSEFNQNQRKQGFQSSYKLPENSYFH